MEKTESGGTTALVAFLESLHPSGGPLPATLPGQTVTCHLAAEKSLVARGVFDIEIKAVLLCRFTDGSHSGSDKNASHFSWRCANDSHASK